MSALDDLTDEKKWEVEAPYSNEEPGAVIWLPEDYEIVKAAAAELAALRAQVSAQAQRIETLEKELEPFAKLEPHIVDGTNGPMLTQVPDRHGIAIAIRRAAAALEPPKA